MNLSYCGMVIVELFCMLKSLSYFNLIFTIIYFLQYLQNGSSVTVAGIISVVLFNWLILRGLERGALKWTVFEWLTGIPAFVFALFTGFSAIFLWSDAIEYDFYPFSSILLIFFGLLFSLGLIVHIFVSFAQKTSKKEY